MPTATTPRRARLPALDPASSDASLARAARAHLAAAHRLDDHDRWVVRTEVHAVLVREAYVRDRTRLRTTFEALFPPPETEPDLRAWFARQRGGFASYRAALAGLTAPRAAVRARAAHFLDRRAREEWNMEADLALGDPRVIARLLTAAADPDATVQAAVLDALQTLVSRTNFLAPAVFERVLALHAASTRPPVRRRAALLLMVFDDPRRWPALAAAFSDQRIDELSRKLLARAVRLGPRDAPPAVARQLTERLFELLAAERKPEVKSLLVRALADVAEVTDVARLRGRVRGVRTELVDEAIATIEARAPSRPVATGGAGSSAGPGARRRSGRGPS